jgi:rRNA-processing protein EBP2
MVKRSKLLAALDAHKGRDYKSEKHKALQKQANKRKKNNVGSNESGSVRVSLAADAQQPTEDTERWESDDGGVGLTIVSVCSGLILLWDSL